MSETETDPNPFAAVTWPESYPDAPQSADNSPPAVTTLAEPIPPENGVSGAKRASEALNQWAKEHGAPTIVPMTEFGATRIAPDGVFIPFGHEWSTKEQKIVPSKMDWTEEDKKLGEAMRQCGNADSIARATGTEAAVCADIAERQRRGIAKYGKTVMANDLPFLQWLQHFYEELLDAAVYAKRIIHDHENQTQNQDDAGAAGVLHRNPALHPSIPGTLPLRDPNGAGNDSAVCPGPVARPRKPGGGRKPLVCPSCGGVKTIGSSMKDGVPIKRCRVCGHVHKSYPHLANAAKAAAKLEGN